MEMTPEERAQQERLEATLRQIPLFEHGKLVLGGGFVLCALLVFASRGMDRFVLIMLAALIAGLGLPILMKGHPRLEGAAHVLRFLLGIVLVLGGLGLAAVGVAFFMAGSYGMLASFVVLPLSILPIMFGWTLLSAGRGAG